MQRTPSSLPAQYELRFAPRRVSHAALSFPCDAQGHVELDALSQQALRDYLYARVVMGHELAMPAVVPGSSH